MVVDTLPLIIVVVGVVRMVLLLVGIVKEDHSSPVGTTDLRDSKEREEITEREGSTPSGTTGEEGEASEEERENLKEEVAAIKGINTLLLL